MYPATRTEIEAIEARARAMRAAVLRDAFARLLGRLHLRPATRTRTA